MKRCGARRRNGMLCRSPGSGTGGRCRIHGGSHPPHHNRGRGGQPYEVLQAGRRRMDEYRRAHGIKAPWGSPPDEHKTKRRAKQMADEIEKLLPLLPVPTDESGRAKLPAEMSLPELMTETSRTGLIACLDICRRYEPEADIKERRLIVEITQGTLGKMIRVMNQEFQQKKSDRIDKLLAELERLG